MRKLICAFIILSNVLGISAQKEKLALESFIDSTNWTDFSGNILVAKQGIVNYKGSYGYEGIDTKQAINESSQFRLASITKTFVAVLILQFVEEGKLKLSDTFGKHLPWYKGEAGQRTTIENLLSFSSGLPNCEGDSGMKVYEKEMNSRDFIEKHCSGKLQFEPGSEFNYENGSFLILGEILTSISKQSFAELLSKRIFSPAGMIQSGFVGYGEKEKPFVEAFLVDDSTKNKTPEPHFFLSNYGGSGAMWSTINDMLKFDEALFSGKLISNTSMKLLLTPHANLYNVSLSLWVYEQEISGKLHTILNRQGSIQGSNTLWMHALETNVTVIILSNSNGMNTNLLGNALLEAALK